MAIICLPYGLVNQSPNKMNNTWTINDRVCNKYCRKFELNSSIEMVWNESNYKNIFFSSFDFSDRLITLDDFKIVNLFSLYITLHLEDLNNESQGYSFIQFYWNVFHYCLAILVAFVSYDNSYKMYYDDFENYKDHEYTRLLVFALMYQYF